MNYCYNYTSLKKRDKKLYSISGTTISQTGISIKFLIVSLSTIAVFQVFGILICIIAGENLYSPIGKNGIDLTFLILMIAIPFGISCMLYFIKIHSYTLMEYVFAYFKKKNTIDEQGRVISKTKYTSKTFVENIF